ncbi:ankyrin repeat domain-containing protein [Leptospira selangorensis]|uniref:Ankyrin repeat domain-containing protein n=1 Tax=Leptospira selangorensis TaxID=2484982 RepID=A0A4R9GDP6_9LEPT|nr:ankyrin repeat domain-containing protein [Leptospira selangorensis]TGK09595.1 ankyrin repeat domain-containing protein [Leptospira selangorensis]TGM16327.1 ankyrin repeat domain-containing protein [Leptospira selangorensis]TGM17722.1 ankyrin repeat domain-containing protein [Leptospira selangorensis]
MKNIILASLLATNVACATATIVTDTVDGKTDKVIERIQNGESLESNKCGTPLYHAAKAGNKELVLLLLQKGANPNSRSSECIMSNESGVIRKVGDRTPLIGANGKEIADILLKAGAKINQVAYLIASKNSHDEDLSYGLPISPLFNAVLSEDYDLAEFYLSKGAKVNLYLTDGENMFLKFLKEFSKSNPKAKLLTDKLIAHGAKNLDVSVESQKRIEKIKLSGTFHLIDNSTTRFPLNIIESIDRDPTQFGFLTDDSVDGMSHHAVEYNVSGTQQNFHEWHIIKMISFRNKK